MHNGNWSQINVQKGVLREYTSAEAPLRLEFEFNPTTITRTRSITLQTGGSPGTQGGYDFEDESEVSRAAQGISVNAESFTVKILLDATDRMNANDEQASTDGIQPELDMIRSMLEPKLQTPEGSRTLSALGEGDIRAFSRQQFASVLIFEWGVHELPVFMTQAQIVIKEFLPTLRPYRAEATLTLQIIESNNPFYREEVRRQFRGAGQQV